MSAITNAGTFSTTTDGSSFAATAFTPTANDLLFCSCYVTGVNNVVATLSDTQSLGWTLVSQTTTNGGVDTLYGFCANTLAAAVSTTITIDVTPQTGTTFFIGIAKISLMSRTGTTAAVRQSISAGEQGAGGTPSLTFNSICLTGNPTIISAGNASNPAAITANASWTLRSDIGKATPASGFHWESRNSGFTGTVWTAGSTSVTGFAAQGWEFDTSAAPSTSYGQDLIGLHLQAVTNSRLR